MSSILQIIEREDFLEFLQILIDKKLNLRNPQITDVLQLYNFIYINDQNSLEQNKKEEIEKNMQKSKIILINSLEIRNQNTNEIYLIIGFEQTLLFIKESSFSFISTMLSNNPELLIYFWSDSKNVIKSYQIQNQEIKKDQTFINKVNILAQECLISIKTQKANKNKYMMIKNIWSFIVPCFAGYLIKKSHYLLKKDRFKDYKHATDIKNNDFIKEEDYIELRNIKAGSSFQVALIYHIKLGELLAIKKVLQGIVDIPKLMERESRNYSLIKHELIPKYYGIVENRNFLVIEYIDGKPLNEVVNELTFYEKTKIIYELMKVIEYLHQKHFVYRDLKPNNVLIDKNKTPVLIDFDNMINMDTDSNNVEYTCNFASSFTAPEIQNGFVSYKSDVYSLGMMISYMFEIRDNNCFKCHYKLIDEIQLECTKKNPENRPSILDVISKFNLIFLFNQYELFYAYFLMNMIKSCESLKESSKKEIDSEKNSDNEVINPNHSLQDSTNYSVLQSIISKDHITTIDSYKTNEELKNVIQHSVTIGMSKSEALYRLGCNYEFHTNPPDIKSAIYFYLEAAKENHPKALLNLGLIYASGEYVPRNLDIAVSYFKQSADLNNSEAQYNLGILYLNDQILFDLNKAIHYFTLSANLNNLEAQFMLGFLYCDSKYVPRDINKAIHYYKLAADQNLVNAQFNLANIYYRGIYIARDINKAIHYYSLAANQNDHRSQYLLGKIYDESNYVKQDIKKAIHYYELAAKQNNKDAQFKLGILYSESNYVKKDLNKAIDYYKCAADQNVLEAMINLGIIYYQNSRIKRDINKAIYYFSLAAKQNDSQAQYYLGCIYYSQQYNTHDINKAIYYFTLSANQNCAESQYNLGIIYENGDFVPRNINKAIHYYSLAAQQNYAKAQYSLGDIYSNCRYVQCDIYRAIHYFQLAANQNDFLAQFKLGFIYGEGLYIQRDINKAIHYYSLAAQQDCSYAQYNLGILYYHGQYVRRDMKKAIKYFTEAARKNNSKAQFCLGMIYEGGLYAQRDMYKAIHYYTLASNQKNSQAQYKLGLIYFFGSSTEKNIKKGVYFMKLSAINGFKHADFAMGYLYHEGKYIERDIQQAIHFYKEASSFNNSFAKNNLAVIYKNGFGDEIKSNTASAVEYLNEANRHKMSYLSMYNLANIYMYDETSIHDINKAIELLTNIASIFYESKVLLCLAIVQKCNFDLESVNEEIGKCISTSNEVLSSIYSVMDQFKKYSIDEIIELYELYRNALFLYDISLMPVLATDIQKKKKN